MSNILSFLKHTVAETGFDSVIRNNRQGKVPAQLGPLEKASVIPLDTCLKEVRADGQSPQQQSCFLQHTIVKMVGTCYITMSP